MSKDKEQTEIPRENPKELATNEKVEEVLAKLPEEIREKLPENFRGEITTLVEQSFFTGPLPPPDLFRQYEEIHPGSADRILKLAEKEQSIREKVVDSGSFIGKLQVSGSIIVHIVLVLGFITGGIYYAEIGQPRAGVVLGGLGIAPIVLRIIELLISKGNNGDG